MGEVSEVKRRHRVEFARAKLYPTRAPAQSHALPLLMLPTRLLRVAAVALAVLAVACGDPTRATATSANMLLSLNVYALTGSPPSTPNAVALFGGLRRADATFDFDLAFDLDASGKVVLYPVRALAGTLAGSLSSRIGLQVVSGTFEALREAPTGIYDTLTVRTISPGTVVAIEVVDQRGQCRFSFGGQFQYAKLVVDSVNVPTRRVYFRTVTDPNCGYRSLVPDEIPER